MVFLFNSLIAHNDAAGGSGRDCSGAYDTVGVSLIQHPAGCAGAGPPDITNVDPETLALRDNGGPTETVAIRRTSPARNAAGDGSLPRDQRGVRRHNPDIGAFEYQR
jgi:hypothetical protein